MPLRHWGLDPEIRFLNHGSFGACPLRVLDEQTRLRAELEKNPVQFMRHLPERLHRVRERVGEFMGADARDIGFVSNATAGVNAVLRSLDFEPGDELLTTDHTYAACKNALDYVAERQGAKVVVVRVPFPLSSGAQVFEALLSGVSPRTKLVLVDHVTSITGLVLDVRAIVRALSEQGVDTLVDGAHAPGMVDVNLNDLGAAYYAANFHKWVCAPKGAGMLWVRRDRQAGIVPPVVSHGYRAPSEERFVALFDWGGTHDPTPYLCVPSALDTLAGLGGGWDTVRATNRRLALQARDALCEALDIAAPAPDELLGSLAAVPLPHSAVITERGADPLYRALFERGFETLVMPWPKSPARVLRVSAQLYNRAEDYTALASALSEVLAAEGEPLHAE